MTTCIQHLSREECLRLLASERLGRVSLSIGALPLILPVHYVLHDDHVVLRIGAGTRLSAALKGSVVGFEVDGENADATAGWSVLIVGHAVELRDQQALEEARSLALSSWTPGGHDEFVIISTTRASGRAFGCPAEPQGLGNESVASHSVA